MSWKASAHCRGWWPSFAKLLQLLLQVVQALQLPLADGNQALPDVVLQGGVRAGNADFQHHAGQPGQHLPLAGGQQGRTRHVSDVRGKGGRDIVEAQGPLVTAV